MHSAPYTLLVALTNPLHQAAATARTLGISSSTSPSTTAPLHLLPHPLPPTATLLGSLVTRDSAALRSSLPDLHLHLDTHPLHLLPATEVTFTISSPSAAPQRLAAAAGALVARVTTLEGAETAANVRTDKDLPERLLLSFVPPLAGVYRVEAMLGGRHLRGSPTTLAIRTQGQHAETLATLGMDTDAAMANLVAGIHLEDVNNNMSKDSKDESDVTSSEKERNVSKLKQLLEKEFGDEQRKEQREEQREVQAQVAQLRQQLVQEERQGREELVREGVQVARGLRRGRRPDMPVYVPPPSRGLLLKEAAAKVKGAEEKADKKIMEKEAVAKEVAPRAGEAAPASGERGGGPAVHSAGAVPATAGGGGVQGGAWWSSAYRRLPLHYTRL